MRSMSNPAPSLPPTRFRLRFLFQEFDLGPGDTLIGRGLDCYITIHDPLVSRHHARIRVDPVRAVIEDLGSRNGVRVNGQLLTEPCALEDGDRIRIGTQELVFGEIADATRTRRTTGSLVYCGGCTQAYPREIGACPSCGSTRVADAEVRAAHLSPSALRLWAFDMVVELLDRAVAAGSLQDIERYMCQAVGTFNERTNDAKPIEQQQLDTLFEAATRLLDNQMQGKWIIALLELCGRTGQAMPEALGNRCAMLSGSEIPTETGDHRGALRRG
jgi:hypothetical protein